MNRYVIKGRGPHRGTYLCFASCASGQRAKGDPSFVWSPHQRKATRWEEPSRYYPTWATDRARLVNGYFVKLIVPASIDVEGLRTFIAEHAKGATDPLPAHWVHGAGDLKKGESEGTNYCLACCEKRVAEILAAHPGAVDDVDVDGIGRTEHDSPPYCETCGAKLDASLTDYGVDQEIEHFITCGIKPDGADDWYDLDNALINARDDDPIWRKIAKIVEAARAGNSVSPPVARAFVAANLGAS